jgi:hypothetical protein
MSARDCGVSGDNALCGRFALNGLFIIWQPSSVNLADTCYMQVVKGDFMDHWSRANGP